jgi:two-component system, chemotaxis family, chemotaxis protein CheY
MSNDPRLRILVVDDYSAMRRIMRSLLTRLGFDDVDDAPDVHAALAMMQKQSYGLVISDWNMEPLNGLEFLKMVRSDRRFADLPFMLVTASAQPEFAAQAAAAGASDYLVKPFTEQVLRQRILSACRLSRAA